MPKDLLKKFEENNSQLLVFDVCIGFLKRDVRKMIIKMRINASGLESVIDWTQTIIKPFKMTINYSNDDGNIGVDLSLDILRVD